MIRAAVAAAAILAATLGAAPAAPRGSGELASGMRYEVAADPQQPVATVALWFRASDDGFGASPAPGTGRLAATTVAASAGVTGTGLGLFVDRLGGRLHVAAYADSVAVTATVPPDAADETVRAMTAAYFAPVVTAAGLQLARREVEEDALFRSFDPESALEDALGAALFATGPLHEGTIGTLAGIRAIGLDAVRGYAERAFRPANATLVLSGAVDPSALGRSASRDDAAPGQEPPAPQTVRPAPATLSQTGNVAGIGLGWIGPPISDEADATALDFVADALFAPGVGRVTTALAHVRASVSGKFVTYHDPGVFLVTISGDDADAARRIVERALAGARAPMSAADFAAARRAFDYDILSSTEAAPDMSDTLGWYAVEGDPGYAPAFEGGRYAAQAAALTPARVAAVIRRYLAGPPAVVTLTKAPPAPART